MNTDTGALYQTAADIAAAQARGEPLALVSERVAKLVTIGSRILDRKATRKRKRQATKASKRANRS